jgi:ATPase subunit of ABC transporter with duplicated ATPase domains
MEYVQKHAGAHAAEEALSSANFPKEMQSALIAEMSVGWRMRLVLAVGFIQNADIVLLDEPTNHLDAESVEWLGDFLLGREKSSIMVISHEPKFLNKVCTDIIAYKDKKMVYYKGNFDDFFAAQGLKAEDMDALLSGNLSLDTEVEAEGEGEAGPKRPAVEAPRAGPPKLSFPIPGQVEGMKSMSRPVIEAKNVSFTYGGDKSPILDGFGGKLCLNSRVDLRGRNGCGKSTLLNLLSNEANPCEGKDGSIGESARHHNVRLGYLMQDHLKTLGPYFDTSPMVYITQRFQEGYDMELQRRLIEPQDEAEAEMREQLAKKLGKYGNQVETLLGRSKQGSQICYEVKWRNLDDPKQNSIETLATLKALGVAKLAIACDERLAAKASGLDQRPLSRREIVKHCEAFGIDEEMCCNRQIRGFSAGQKVRLSFAAMFWTRPHFIVLDEPTNYLDVETVEALSKALRSFRGGMIMVSPDEDFSNKICNERWLMADGKVTVEKLDNGNKRVA